MKKALIILLAALMFTLAACRDSGVPASSTGSQTAAAQTTNSEEAERIAKEEAERKAKEEAERIAKEEAERKAKEEAERLAKEEAERIAKEEKKLELMASLQQAYDNSDWRAVKNAAAEIMKGYAGTEEAATAEAYSAEAVALLEEAGEKALAKMTTKHDKVENRTWYYPPSAPKYTNDRTCFYLYFGQSGKGEIWMRCVANYTGDDWIFFEKLIYSIDGENTSKTLTRDEYYRDNAYGDVWEVADYGMGNVSAGVPDYDREMLERIINSDETIIRFQGDNYHYDHTVTQKEKDGLTVTLQAFDYLYDKWLEQ